MRFCKLRLRGWFHNYNIFSAHAPTEEKETSEKCIFYDMLEKLDIKIILVDFKCQNRPRRECEIHHWHKQLARSK
jgi:hypothetical protein